MARRLYVLLVAIIVNSCTNESTPPHGQWLGRVEFENITYRMFLDTQTKTPRLLNVTFKSNQVQLDTIYFNGDSLRFRFEEFYTEFKGRYDRNKNTIVGIWTADDSTERPVIFVPVLADTVRGLHPRNTNIYKYHVPQEFKDEIPTCSMSEQHITPALADTLTRAIMREKYPDVHSMLIARNNCLVYEEYFYTFDRKFPQNIQSVTKSFVSALTGIAIGKGEIKNVKETVCNRLPDFPLACNEQNKSITLHNLLSMSSGLKWDEATYDYLDDRNSAAIAAKEPDAFNYLLSQSRSETPVFAYNSLNHLMMNAILKEATHLENNTELRDRLLTPIGANPKFIGEPEKGILGDINLQVRDMLKLGLLYLNNGSWRGKQVVPADWVKESTSTKIPIEPGLGYGYFWWTKEFIWKGKPVQSFFAWGYGGQYILVVPEARLVVVMSGSHWGTDPKNYVMEMMQQVVLKACF